MGLSRIVGLVLLAGMGVACMSPTADDTDGQASDVTAAPRERLLALGDSITYGWKPDWSQDQPGAPHDPANLQRAVLGQGYPEKVGARLGLAVHNASCPGEASGSFIDPKERDNGCRDKRRDGLKMTTPWGDAQTQLEYALREIKSPVPPKVITMTLGGNDLFLVQDDCEDAAFSTLCIASAATLGTDGAPVTKYRKNLEATLMKVYEAGYRGTFVMVTTYAMSYSLLSGEPLVFGAFNGAVRKAAENVRHATPGMTIVIADAYEKFKERAAESDKSSCKAGLLINTRNDQPITDDKGKPTCDRHPSQAGHELLADAVVDALNAAATSEH